ncbi:MAG: hypothetical protein ABFS34_06135 [Gemmatimonadota bacterium]
MLRTLTLGLVAAALAGVVHVFRYPLHVDIGFLLDLSERVMDGETLYREALEPNPPLVVYLMAVPVGLARLTGASPVVLLRLMLVALVAVSAVGGWRSGRRYLAPAVAAFLCVAFAASALVVEPGEFGQRDGVMFALLFPYLVTAGARIAAVPVSRSWAIAVGIAAGVGVALKPFFVPLLVLVEVAVVLGRGRAPWRRPETLAAACFLLAYATWIAAFARDYLRVARLASEHYGFFAPIARVDLAALGVVIVLVSAWAFVLAWSARPARPLAGVLLAASLGLVMAVILQGKGFPYHWVPTYLAAVVLLALAAASVLAEAPSLPRAVPAAVLTALLIAVGWSGFAGAERAWDRLDRYPYYLTDFSRLVQSRPAGESVFSFWVAPGFPLVTYTDASWGSSFSSHWLLPSMHQREKRGEDMAEVRSLVLDVIAKDLRERAPGLLLVDIEPRYNNLTDFDFLAFMRSDPEVAASLEGYRELTRVGEFLVLERAAGATRSADPQ